jgi:LPS export ABC transporter protein LptC
MSRRVQPGASRARAAAGGLLAVGMGLTAGGCQGNELAPRRPLTEQAESQGRVPDQIIEEGTHVLTREGVKKAILNARRIYFYNAEGKVEADSVRVTFYDANGIEQSHLNADRGEIDQRTSDMIARGKVLVVSEDGSRIQGDELRYDATRDMIVSTKPVTIFQKTNRIQGQGVETDPGLTNIRMTGTSAELDEKPRVGGGRRAPRPSAASAGDSLPPGPTPGAEPPSAPAPGAGQPPAPAPGAGQPPAPAPGAEPPPAPASGTPPAVPAAAAPADSGAGATGGPAAPDSGG